MGKQDTIIKNIKAFLKDKGILEDVDVTLIEELAYCEYLCSEAQADIKERGYVVDISKEGNTPYYQTNPSVNGYITALKSITAISTKLGITPMDRTKLNLQSQEGDDPLDDIIK